MAFDLQPDYVVLDGNEFASSRNTIDDRYYFDERVATRGILNFGLVKKEQEARIDLAANGINAPLIIESIVALSANSESDEIYFNLYIKQGDNLIRIGRQRYSNAQMPIDFPDGIIKPGMVLGVTPRKADSTISVYVKPVQILFEVVAEAASPNFNNGPNNNEVG